MLRPPHILSCSIIVRSRLFTVDAAHSAPAYTDFACHIFIAEGLCREPLPGDETVPLQPVPWPRARLGELYRHPEVNDSRVLLALMLLEKHLCE